MADGKRKFWPKLDIYTSIALGNSRDADVVDRGSDISDEDWAADQLEAFEVTSGLILLDTASTRAPESKPRPGYRGATIDGGTSRSSIHRRRRLRRQGRAS